MTDDGYSEPEFVIEATSDLLAADDERWLNELDALRSALEAELGRAVVRHDTQPAPGMKGGVATLVVALGSAGAFQAAATVFREWVRRAQDRNITIRIGDQVVKVTGRNVRDESLVESLRAAVDGAR